MGLSGGMVLAWRKDNDTISFMHADRQVISSQDGKEWILAITYVSTNGMEKRSIWESINQVQQLRLYILLVEDFNCILNVEDKKGAKAFKLDRDIRKFRTCMQNNGIIDMEYEGPKFIWYNNRIGLGRAWERLDRAFAIGKWMDLYPETKINHLMRYASDHYPIFIALENWYSRGSAPLIFEKFWLRYLGVYKL